DIENAIRYENLIISGGQLPVDGMKRSLSVNGEFTSAEQIGNVVVRSIRGGMVYLKDVAEVIDSHKDQESFARLDGKNVITLNVIKRNGENLISAADQIKDLVKEFESGVVPSGMKLTVTADQSEGTRTALNDLINTIIIGFVLVTLILMFFMGATNAIFVGLSVPISSFITFLVMPGLDFTLNIMTLFSFLLALGIVVDDAIVVIENTHRVFGNGKMPIKKAAKLAAGEVFLPVLSGTMVVLAPFVPLIFWPGTTGSFMKYLPITLIVALLASLVVAYLINPVFAVDFMKPHETGTKQRFTRGYRIAAVVFASLALMFYVTGVAGMGNFTLFLFLIYSLHRFYLEGVIRRFQERTWPRVQSGYFRMVNWCLQGKRPLAVVGGVVVLFIFSIFLTAVRQPPVGFFPKGDPNFIFAYVRMPIGTDQNVTDSVVREVERRVNAVVKGDGAIVESVISNVAIGASENQFEAGQQSNPHLGKISVAFVKFEERDGKETREYLNKIREAVKDIYDAEVTVDQEQMGPPQGKPVNIEIASDDFGLLVSSADKVKKYLDSIGVAGVEELKSDFQSNKPEIVMNVDREKANREGISTGQIGGLLRTAILGKEISKFRDTEDDYPVQLRLKKEQRSDINTILNLPVTYRDMNMGGAVRQVPLSAVATADYSNSYAGIRRINQKRVITLSSNVLGGYNGNAVVAEINGLLPGLQLPEGVTVKMTGEQENQQETVDFLGTAFIIAFLLIFMILVTQFNSVGKPFIILMEILFSVIGVLIGFSVFKMEVSIVMSGVGIMALAGIVVRNGILLVEFTDLLLAQGMPLREAIAEAARTRMTPVLLTAMAATLGLIPLAVGLNIDFVSLFTHFEPNIFFGGDNVTFWGPLSWTMIFGLIFGTFLTLFLVPVMYLIISSLKRRLKGIKASS
ncbi:MAG: efflux RND transporter permease subunit, partial [Bacteroidota bacterium]